MLVIAAVAALTVFFALQLPRLRFDYDFEAFFPNEDRELEFYSQYREKFGHDNEFVLVAAENRAGIFRREFLQRFDSLTRALATVEHVRQVISPTTLRRSDLRGLAPVSMPLLHPDEPERYARDSALIYSDRSLRGSFFPDNARSLALFIHTDPGLSKKRSDTLANRIMAVVSKYRFDEVHVTGRVFGQQAYLEQVRREFILFICIAFVVVVIFLWITLRSLYGIIVPLTVVMLSILWTLGIMVLLDKPIDIMSTMLPTMIFITGMSDVVHFFSKYLDLHAEGTPREKIFPVIMREVAYPTFLTLLTTVVAFLSLLFSALRPVRDFGVYTSVGICIAFALTYTLLPAIMFFVHPPVSKSHGSQQKVMNRLRSLLFWIFRHQKAILAGTVVLIAVSLSGIMRIETNSTLMEDMSEKVRAKKDLLFFDRFYSGVRPLEIGVSTRGQTILTYSHIKALHEVDSFVRVTYKPGFLISPSVLVEEISRSKGNGEGFPSGEEYAEIRKLISASKNNRQLKRIISADGSTARLSGKIRDAGSREVKRMNGQLNAFIASRNFGDLTFTITGAAHLMDRNNDYMVENMMQGFFFSVIIIGLLTFFLHRSWRMVLVFILPNLIPLLLMGGIMGFAGIELKAATSIIFSIAFGIATDDTIHFISRLKIERAYGKSLLYAFKRTYFETGKPIALTTFILLGGFISLTASDFRSTFYFGLLTCITIVIALAADLLLLPVLLLLIYRERK